MTPAIKAARLAGIEYRILEFEHIPGAAAYGEEAARALGLPAEAVFKTLVAALDDKRLTVAILPVTRMLDLKALARHHGAKRAAMAEGGDAERATGYVVGGISPLGQKRRLPTVVDSSAQLHETIYVSAGRRGLELGLSPMDLQSLCAASFANICQ